MALSIAEANTVSSQYFDTTLTQQYYEDSALWMRLLKKNKVRRRGGVQIQFPIRYTGFGKADAVTPRSQMTFEQKETRTAGVLDWKYYRVPQMISWDERVKNTGKPQIISLLSDKTTEMKQDMNNRFATDLFTANPNGEGIADLGTIIDSTTTYAGIAYTDAAEWVAREDTSTTQLNLYGSGSLAYMINYATFGRYSPDFHLTTKDLASKFESLVEPQKRYEDKETADAGFRNVTFHGAPVVGDPKCTAASWFGIATETFEIFVHDDWDMVLSPWTDLFQAGFPQAMGRVLAWAGNIVCNLRKANFKFTVLDYTL